MIIKQTIEFTKEDEETIKRLGKMLRNFDCHSVPCKNCPFHEFCNLLSIDEKDEDYNKVLDKIKQSILNQY